MAFNSFLDLDTTRTRLTKCPFAFPVMKIYLLILFFVQLSRPCLGLGDLRENVILAQCRGSCLKTFTSSCKGSRDECCQTNIDCYVCWSSCRLFQGNHPAKSTLCTDQTACFPGCKTACKFYDVSSHRNLTPPLLTSEGPLLADLAPPRLTSDGHLEWRPPIWPGHSQARLKPPNDVIVYIVMSKMGGDWNQHIQTSTLRAIIPNSLLDSELRVLAVTSSGLVARADLSTGVEPGQSEPRLLSEGNSPAPPKPREVKNNEENQISDPNYQRDTAVRPDDGAKVNPVSTSRVSTGRKVLPPSVTIDQSWIVKLKLLSSELLATIEVSWDYRGDGDQEYMVTWSETNGGVSGHLVMKNDRAEISLWTGQKYDIQVDLLGPHGNPVLRSSPKTINFKPEGILETIELVEAPTSSTPRFVSTTKVTIKPTTDHSTSNLKDIERWDHIPTRIKYPRPSTPKKGGPNYIPFPKDTVNDHSDPPSAFEPRWINEASYVRDQSGYSSQTKVPEVHTLNDERSAELNPSSPLLAWISCLGVGAVVIVILIVLAVRTLRKSTLSKHDQIRPTDDYLSDTTTSSVNSSAPTVCSHVSRGHQSNGPSWPYDTYYGVTHAQHPTTVHTQSVPQPQPGVALGHSVHLGPVVEYRPTWQCSHGPQESCGTHAPSSPTVRIDNASFVENYLLTLDPSPVIDKPTH